MLPDTKKERQRVFLVDDHPLVREWLATLINQEADLHVCGQAGTAAEAMELIPRHKPDLVIVDISLGESSGLTLIKDLKIQRPKLAILVLSMHGDLLYADRALRAGARGYIMKQDVTKKVLPGIRSVLAGKLYLSEKIVYLMAEKMVEGTSVEIGTQIEELSDRELEVFQLLGKGRDTRQIADHMQVSFKTVQSFCARIKKKLKVTNARGLIDAAVRWHDSQQGR